MASGFWGAKCHVYTDGLVLQHFMMTHIKDKAVIVIKLHERPTKNGGNKFSMRSVKPFVL